MAREILREARRALDDGRWNDALGVLSEALRRDALAPHAVPRAGELILRALDRSATPPPRVLLMGQCTTVWLKHAVAAVALARGMDTIVEDSGFDNVLQSVSALPHHAGPGAPILMLLPWSERLLARSERSHSERVADEVGYWRDVWDAARVRGVTRIIQVGFDFIGPGPLGYHLGEQQGDAHLVRAVNDALRAEMPSGCYFVSLADISGYWGRRDFYDPRSYYWTRQPFSEQGLVALAEHLVAAMRAVTTGPKKVVILDLDDTLWGGVVGEVGPSAIALGGGPEGDAFVAFQRYLKGLSDRGILLAVCSKNDPSDAREPFAVRSECQLSLSDFAAFEASWDPKPEGIRRIATALNLGLDSFVFFDDNPAERELVRQSLPEVMVVEVPRDPSGYVRALEETLAFEAAALTIEDVRRREQYANDHHRRAAARDAGSVQDYLHSLKMDGALEPIDASSLPRVAQLLAKTNQFNLTTRRHTAAQVQAMCDQPGAICCSLRLRDRFGDHGLVAVLIAIPAEGGAHPSRVLTVDSLLLSCRVIGRTVEHRIVRHLIEEARRVGYEMIRAEYVPSDKNGQVRGLWESMGFRHTTRAGDSDDGPRWFELSLADAALPESLIQVVS